MDEAVVWIVAGLVVVAMISLIVVLPISIIPHKPARPEEHANNAVDAAQDEAEALCRRRPPAGWNGRRASAPVRRTGHPRSVASRPADGSRSVTSSAPSIIRTGNRRDFVTRLAKICANRQGVAGNGP
jgi:hypothetical protein